MTRAEFSFAWLVAYDWRRAIPSMARLWRLGVEHVIGYDRGGVTWGGGRFTPPTPEGLRAALIAAGLSELAVDARLRIVAGDWYSPGVHVADLETHERQSLSWACRKGTVQAWLDADEEPCNWPELVEWFGDRGGEAIGYTAHQIPVYKVIGDTALVFSRGQRTPVVLGTPGLFDGPRACCQTAPSPLRLVNWWLDGMTEDELLLKFRAMSYIRVADVDPREVLDQWRTVTLENYRTVEGFPGTYGNQRLHPISVADLRAGRWAELEKAAGPR